MLIKLGKIYVTECDKCGSRQVSGRNSIYKLYVKFGWTYNNNANKHKTLCPICSEKRK